MSNEHPKISYFRPTFFIIFTFLGYLLLHSKSQKPLVRGVNSYPWIQLRVVANTVFRRLLKYLTCKVYDFHNRYSGRLNPKQVVY